MTHEPPPQSPPTPSPASQSPSPEGWDAIPQAEIRSSADRSGPLKAFWATRMWWATAACLLLAIALTASTWQTPGPLITIQFAQGHGIAPGNSVRLRGIDVGTVEQVSLSSDLQHVEVHVRLTPAAKPLATTGTLFWIERPQIGLSGVRGLDTVVGPNYIGVQPATSAGELVTHFIGSETPRQSSTSPTTVVEVTFHQGHGLQAGSPVKFRGVQIGEVVEVALLEDLSRIRVRAELSQDARGFARAGSQFWVERPQLGIGNVRGLDTMVTGPVLSVSPGNEQQPEAHEFVGLETPPAEAEATGGLEIVLSSDSRFGLQAGSPVHYRGVVIGKVLHVGLASDATTVETRLYIEPSYTAVVREDSRFWPTSGWDVTLGLRGLTLDADSLASIAAGGVSLATPNSPGRTVAAGHRFELQSKAENEWLDWNPNLQVGPKFWADRPRMPSQIRATFNWNQRVWGLLRAYQQRTWIHPLSPQRFVCPVPWQVNEAPPGDLTIEIQGQTLTVPASQLRVVGELLVISQLNWNKTDLERWEPAHMRAPAAPEDCVLIAGTESVPLSAAHIRPGARWGIDVTLKLSSEWHGASVVARADGALLGLVVWLDGEAAMVPLQRSLLSSRLADSGHDG